MWKPTIQNMTTPIRIIKRSQTTVNGSPKITYAPAPNRPDDFCGWKGKGGTENIQSGTLAVEETAEITMWYRADISPKDRILLRRNAALAYDVLNVENVEERSVYLIVKVKRAVNA